MKPNYITFRSKILNEFKLSQADSTNDLDSLAKTEIAAMLEKDYKMDYNKCIDLLYEENTKEDFVKAAYKLIG